MEVINDVDGEQALEGQSPLEVLPWKSQLQLRHAQERRSEQTYSHAHFENGEETEQNKCTLNYKEFLEIHDDS